MTNLLTLAHESVHKGLKTIKTILGYNHRPK